MTAPTKLSGRALVALVAGLMMLQALSTDFYLASLPSLGQYFHASREAVQLTLSMFMLGFAAMQLIVGPLSDRFGRYPVLVSGLALYFAASIACASASSMALLIGARFLQAFGCCASVVISRALIRDLFEPLEGVHKLAQVSTVLTLGPLLGPILGSFLQVEFGWRASFVALSVFSAVLLLVAGTRLGETNRRLDRSALRPAQLAANYVEILSHRQFLAYALLGALSYAGLFAFIAGSSSVLIEVLHVPTAYFGFCFSLVVLGYLSGTLLCRWLLRHWGLRATLAVGAWCSLLGGGSMVALAAGGVHHYAAIVLPQFVYLMGHGVNFPCSQSGAVGPFPEKAGAAAGLLGALSMLLAFGVGQWIGASHNGTVYPMVLTVAFFGALTFLNTFLFVRRAAGGSPGPAARAAASGGT
jgi:MFS transporter, DHA1 family, multidrug resistance protein